MAYRKRTYKRRSTRRTRRMTLRRTLNPATGTMVRRTLRTPMVHAFRRMTAPAQIIGSVAYAPYLSTSGCSLSQVINATDFANLFDQYRINFVVLKFWLKIDPGAQTASTASYPKMYWYRDYDDNTVPGSLSEIRENSKAHVTVMNPNRPVTIKFKPNTLQLLFQSGVANQYKPVFSQWLDMSTTTTYHYGIKYGIDDLTNTNYRVDIEQTIYFQCRQPR